MKKIKPAILLIFVGTICFVCGWSIKNVQFLEMEFNYGIIIDSIKKSEFLREEEQSKYFGMKEEDVIKLLPTPNDYREVLVFDDGEIDEWHWMYLLFANRIKNTNDTLIIRKYYWNIPYVDRPSIYIAFEEKDSVWIATVCVEWDPGWVDIM